MRTSLLPSAIFCALLLSPLHAAAQGTIFNPEVPDDDAGKVETKKKPAKPTSKPAAAKPRGESGELWRPSTRGMLVSAALGPAFELKNLPTQFKLEAAFAYHFSKGPIGPALGGVFGVAFGNQLTTIEVAARFWWDFQILAAYGIYVGPFAQAGWRFFTDHRCYAGVSGALLCGQSNSDSYFGIALGVDARVVFADRWFLLFRPAAFTLDFGSETVSRYELVLGGGVTF